LEGLSLLDGAGLTFARRRALLNAELADAYAVQGRPSEADSRFKAAYSLLQAIGKAESLNGVAVLGNWAGMHLRFGSPKRALEMYLQAKDTAQRRSPGAQVSPPLLIQISNATRQVGRAEEAAQTYRIAADAARKAGSSRAEAFALTGLVLSVMEQKLPHPEAQQWLDRARALIGASVDDSRTAIGSSWLLAQAQAWHRHGESTKAKGLLDTAVQRLSTGSSPTAALVTMLMWRGLIASDTGSPGDAQRDLELALSHAKRLPAPGGHSSFTGRAELALAEHHLREGQPQAAEAHARQALRELEPSVGADSVWVSRAKELLDSSVRASLAASGVSR
ncbi:tetratricopeptide repeat protein, partial [Nostoc sp. NIES-2111]